MLGALLGAIAAPLIGGLFGASGQASANSANAAQNSENNAFNANQADLSRTFSAEQAAKQMEFQQYNADTQWQRGVKDMEAAGLSPMLAYMKGGNASPAGSMAQSATASAASPIAMQNVAAASAQSANLAADTANKVASKALIDAQTTNTSAQTSTLEAQVKRIEAEIPGINQNNLNLKEQQVVIARTAELVFQQSGLAASGVQLNVDSAAKARQDTNLSRTQMNNAEALVKKLAAETSLANFDIEAARSMSNLGREAGQLGPIIKMITDIIRVSR